MIRILTNISKLYFYIPIVAFGLLFLVLQHTLFNINHDVTLFLEIGTRITEGQLPYVDFYEINFPVIQYMSAIPAFISNLTNTNIIIVAQLSVWILVGLSALSIFFLTRKITKDEHLPYILSTAIIFYSTALQVTSDGIPLFAQREHIFLLLFLPFLMIRIWRWQNQDDESFKNGRFIYGFIAAIGVAIKPYFAIIPIATELYGLSIHRDWRRFKSAEIFGFVVFALLHVIYFLLYPQVLQGLFDMLALARYGYGTYITINHPFPLFNWLVYPEIRDTLMLLMVFWLIKYTSTATRIVLQTLSIMALAGILIFSMQIGFRYHMIVFHALAWTLIFYIMTRFFHPTDAEQKPQFDLLRNPFVYIILLVSVYLMVIFFSLGRPRTNPMDNLTDYQQFILDHTDENEKLVVLDYQFDGLNYPDLYQINRRNSSPYPIDAPYSLGWKEADTVEKRINTPSPYVDTWLENISQHITATEPRVIVVNPEIDDYLDGIGFVEEFLLSSYAQIEANDHYVAYLRSTSSED